MPVPILAKEASMIGPRGTLLTICLLAPLGEGQPPADPGRTAKIWVGRQQEIEEYLRTAECVSMEALGSSRVARCTLRPGGPIARIAWRPLPPGSYRGFHESYKAEIAAYELDKLLELDMVPPSVERQLQGHTGAAQLWVEGVTSLSAAATRGAPEGADWQGQVVRMSMFDNLIGNAERNMGNMLRDDAGNLVLIDHSRAFADRTELPSNLGRIDRGLWSKIEGLTRSRLDAALGAWLSEKEIEAILGRRDRMRAGIRSMTR
jgi:hypothetical protein